MDRSGQSTRYLPHVDGLRALAIIPVVLYHFFPASCPGGFSGVDVFFVISGFLIVGGITKDLEEGVFSVSDFYVRRIKRIFPAYLGLIAFVLGIGPWIYTTSEYRSLATSALYSAFYCANIYFNSVVGYFDLAAKRNPLLHLWSLGVEEQFYLIIPAVTWMLWALGKRKLLSWSLIFLFAGSFLFSLLCVQENRLQYAFFMLPSRSWELLAGAILSQIYPAQFTSRGYSLIGGGAGFALLLSSYVFLHSGTPFPGAAALPAVLGACLLIYFGKTGIFGEMLGWKPCVWVGRISYSLYLWHWPLFVLMRSAYSMNRTVRGLLATAIASAVSYYLIETPVRRSKVIGRRQAFSMLIAGCLLVACPYWWITSHKDRNGEMALSWRGIPTWEIAEQKRSAEMSSCQPGDLDADDSKFKIKIGSDTAKPSFALWGDSFALALLPGVDMTAAEHQRAGYFVNLTQTLTLDPNVGAFTFTPVHDRKVVLDWLCSRPEITDILLVNDWTWHVRVEDDIAETCRICQLLQQAGKKVYFFNEPPWADFYSLKQLSYGRRVDPAAGAIDKGPYEAAHSMQKKLADELVKRHLATVIPINDAFLSQARYWTSDGAQSYFFDVYHLNSVGALRAMRFVAPMIWK
jgi:peptidoglycan/LPS O-acetylase OafA/YrhL